MRRTYGMQLTIEKYTQMVAPLDVRDLELVGAARRLLSDEFGDDRSERFDIVCADHDVTESPSFAAA